jgi:hypothetical protein
MLTTLRRCTDDSVCGIPLFVAPRGRTFAAWEAESLSHGWPSFRDPVSTYPSSHLVGHVRALDLAVGYGPISRVCVPRARPRPPCAQEVVEGNVIVGKDGEVHSKCGTHLGHNLPDAGDPRSRYCLDLVCLAGNPNSK